MSETADKNTFAGALAQESSHYVTLGNFTITPSICQQFFPSFSIFFSNKKMFPLIVLVVPLIYGYNKKKRKTEEQLLSNMTKRALEESLKRLLLKKPLTKITINDLTTDCGISRMTFYYHFKDIYDLVEWACVEDGKKALRDKKTYDTWQEGFAQIFEAVLENKPFIMNVYHSVRREKIESFLYKLTYQLIADVVEEKCFRDHLPETDKQFIADFYKYGFVGIMLDWIDRGMKEDYQKIVDLLAVTLHGNIANSIRNFEQVKEKM